MSFQIIPMTEEHVDDVAAVEQASFSIPWRKNDFIRELANLMAVYFVVQWDEKVVGFGGMWHVVNEGHITNIAILEEYRGKGLGRALVERLISEGKNREMIGITLEVRISNLAAQKLYTSFGFVVEGMRKKYYEDTGEDALIMWKYF